MRHLTRGFIAALLAASYLLARVFYIGQWYWLVVIALGFWGVLSVSELWQLCDRYERFLRSKGIDPVMADPGPSTN
jgi:hypothetical protein